LDLERIGESTIVGIGVERFYNGKAMKSIGMD